MAGGSMYFFVRFAAIVKIIFGILLMLLGVAVVIFALVNNAAVADLVNRVWLANTNIRLYDSRPYASILGLVLFLLGTFVSALGQLLLVFVDTAVHTRETARILRGMRKPEAPTHK